MRATLPETRLDPLLPPVVRLAACPGGAAAARTRLGAERQRTPRGADHRQRGLQELAAEEPGQRRTRHARQAQGDGLRGRLLREPAGQAGGQCVARVSQRDSRRQRGAVFLRRPRPAAARRELLSHRRRRAAQRRRRALPGAEPERRAQHDGRQQGGGESGAARRLPQQPLRAQLPLAAAGPGARAGAQRHAHPLRHAPGQRGRRRQGQTRHLHRGAAGADRRQGRADRNRAHRALASASWTNDSFSESRWLVASSRITIAGSFSSILAIESRCFSPPDIR